MSRSVRTNRSTCSLRSCRTRFSCCFRPIVCLRRRASARRAAASAVFPALVRSSVAGSHRNTSRTSSHARPGCMDDRVSEMGGHTVMANAPIAAGPGSCEGQPPMAIQVVCVCKTYGSHAALAGVTFEVRAGEIFGVLGPNGAGKTTLIEILEGLRIAESGTVAMLGVDVPKHLDSIRHRVGIAMQKVALPSLLTVHEAVRLYAAVYPRS